MVSVAEKRITRRVATASGKVRLGKSVLGKLREGELWTAKGAVFQTAIIAGTMAAKETARLIPFCHPIALENCRITITPMDEEVVEIHATVTCEAKTGVEMEALTAVSATALTLIDMTKAISPESMIESIGLLSKEGGKTPYQRSSAE